jgi:uncharacterized protein
MKVVPLGFLAEVAERPSTHLCAAKRYIHTKVTPLLAEGLILLSSEDAACGMEEELESTNIQERRRRMRRKEFSIDDEQEIIQFLSEMSFGCLGTIGEDGWPHVIPLNFVYHKGNIYFHGSKIGQKIRDLEQNNRVTFTVAKEYAIIPSYLSDPKLACPATSFFKSVMIRGYASFVNDLEEKADIFGAFMKKLQPEGGYAPIDPQDEAYAKNLAGVALVRLSVEEISAKFKFGQNLQPHRFEKVVDGLQERGERSDMETIELMHKYCPHHQNG